MQILKVESINSCLKKRDIVTSEENGIIVILSSHFLPFINNILTFIYTRVHTLSHNSITLIEISTLNSP